MAIDYNNAKFLISCLGHGVSYEKTLTLGHLGTFIPKPITRKLLDHYSITIGDNEQYLTRGGSEDDEYSDWFFYMLGCSHLDTMDYSDYEAATVIHDLNTSIPDSLVEQFDCVVDGGTIEHVFNYPIAIANAMRMVKVGGSLILDQPFNNCAGHGFYQPSPELFFAALSKNNGFEVIRVIVCEDFPCSQWYEVQNPEAIQARVILTNKAPVRVLVAARKTSSFSGFGVWPAQSDYKRSWAKPAKNENSTTTQGRVGLVEKLRRVAKKINHEWYWSYSVRRNANRELKERSLANHEHFKPVTH